MSSCLFLGTGSSMGVPLIGCNCHICQSENPLNRRLRTSAFLQIRGKNFLIDVGPDFREQALRYNIQNIDGILLTHPHFDHIGGLDDLRIFNFILKKPLPCLLSGRMYHHLKKRYDHIFQPYKEVGNIAVEFDYQIVEKDFDTVSFLDEKFSVMTFFQQDLSVSGYRIDDFAYITDIKTFSEEVVESLKGVKTLVLSAPRYRSSPVHFSVDEALDFITSVGAEKTYLTHLSHDIDMEDHPLPENVFFAYDGLKITF
ncbi:MAG TPA: MBL fold metallo-hydrolase [Chlamydiales bacterium]|nr:MBL fold metallo-hydrolase [Chlamydiales bacterium]